MRTWVDASTIIGLDRIGKIGLLRKLIGKVHVTPQVAAEVRAGPMSTTLSAAFGTWIIIHPVQGRLQDLFADALGPGESSLLRTPAADRLVIDDLPARRIAEAEGRDFVGLLGLLRDAAECGTLSRGEYRSIVKRLLNRGFHIAGPLLVEMLRNRIPGSDEEE